MLAKELPQQTNILHPVSAQALASQSQLLEPHKNKASCFGGELAGSVEFGGSCAHALQKEAHEEAKKHGEKYKYLQHGTWNLSLGILL